MLYNNYKNSCLCQTSIDISITICHKLTKVIWFLLSRTLAFFFCDSIQYIINTCYHGNQLTTAVHVKICDQHLPYTYRYLQIPIFTGWCSDLCDMSEIKCIYIKQYCMFLLISLFIWSWGNDNWFDNFLFFLVWFEYFLRGLVWFE